MSSVFANSRSIVHKGDGGVQTCPAPDPCKTPTPGGPVPIPYINIAQNGALADGSTSVKIEGNSIALRGSNLSVSSGDEGGTAGGGLISSKIKGKLTWAAASTDVKVEDQCVVRFLEVCLHNGNKSNSGSQPMRGETGLTYGGESQCSRCGATGGHPIKSNRSSETAMRDLMRKAPADRQGGGYMMGVLVCQAPNGMLVVLRAHSGNPVPGFPWHPKSKPDDPPPSGNTKDCAAQRLIKMAHSRGLIPLAMTEAWRGPRKGRFKPDRHAESCQACQKELPRMLCPKNPTNPRNNR